MSGNRSEIVHLLAGNKTGAEDPGGPEERSNELIVYKVLSISGVTFALILFIMSVITCFISYHKHHRRYRRACDYEDRVKSSENRTPLSITGVKRVRSFHKSLALLKNRDRSSFHSQVYFIYNNPAMTEEEETEEVTERKPANNQITDTKSTGIILNPCVFYA
ncbi:uncharacterized protein ACNLHF_019788 [Anomaloglossus baeobatrachus]